jgi:hypothetical protein
LKVPIHELLPRVSEVWRCALEAVPTDRPGEGILSNAYVFPPIHLFLNETKGLAFLACWAFIRLRWIGSLTMGSFEDIAETSSAPPKTRVWSAEVRRMSMEWYSQALYTAQNPSGSATAATAQRPGKAKADNRRKERMAAEATETFSFLRAQNDIPADFSTNAILIQRDSELAITPTTARQHILSPHYMNPGLFPKCSKQQDWKFPMGPGRPFCRLFSLFGI